MRDAKLEHVYGNSEPPEVAAYMENGVRWLRLARNAAQSADDGPDGPQAHWEWDELRFPSDMPEPQAIAGFDVLWYEGTRAAMTDGEWRSDIESALLDLMEVALGGGE